MSEDRRAKQVARRYEEAIPPTLRRFVLMLQRNWLKVLSVLGVSGLTDILREFMRNKLVDEIYTHLGTIGIGRWLIAYPAAFFTLGLFVTLVTVVIWTLKQSPVTKSSTICDERGIPYQRQSISPNWTRGLAIAVVICIWIILYGTFRYYQISVGHFKVNEHTEIILPALPLTPPAPVPANPPSLLDVFNDDFPNLLRARNDLSIEGTNTWLRQQVYLDFPDKADFVGFFIPRSPNPILAADTPKVCTLLIDQVPVALAQLSKNTWMRAGFGDEGNTIDELTFTGRVLIYHEDLLSITQKAEIITAYKLKKLDVQFRGFDYLIYETNIWRQRRESQKSH